MPQRKPGQRRSKYQREIDLDRLAKWFAIPGNDSLRGFARALDLDVKIIATDTETGCRGGLNRVQGCPASQYFDVGTLQAWHGMTTLPVDFRLGHRDDSQSVARSEAGGGEAKERREVKHGGGLCGAADLEFG